MKNWLFAFRVYFRVNSKTISNSFKICRSQFLLAGSMCDFVGNVASKQIVTTTAESACFHTFVVYAEGIAFQLHNIQCNTYCHFAFVHYKILSSIELNWKTPIAIAQWPCVKMLFMIAGVWCRICCSCAWWTFFFLPLAFGGVFCVPSSGLSSGWNTTVHRSKRISSASITSRNRLIGSSPPV